MLSLIWFRESLPCFVVVYRYEQEDAELKHNSTLKQLMREFNTQLAQKEKEVETAVREAISEFEIIVESYINFQWVSLF